MELIRTRQIVRSHDGEPLFGPLDLVLSRGRRLGLVGPNASGKSALLDTLAGVVAPDSGSLQRSLGVRIGYLTQDVGPVPSGVDIWHVASGGLAAVREAEQRMRAAEHRLTLGAEAEHDYSEAIASFEGLGGYGAEAELLRALAAVGFGPDRLATAADRLSGGERRRLALATAMAGTPEVLLLDEPTNHLDLTMRRWLAARLARWPGAIVVVSHDRALLDATTGSTLFLGRGASELRRGAYTRANAARQQGLVASRRKSKEREREAERLRAMARELASFGGRGAQRRRRVAERRVEALTAKNDTSGPRPSAAQTGTLRMETRGLRGLLLEARHLRKEGVIDVPLLRLHAGEHVALLGPNGSGKTTLLLMLAGLLASDDPRSDVRTPRRLRLALIGQLDRGLEEGAPIIDQLERLALPQRARDLLVRAGLGPAAWERPPEQLSGGQRARAGLALLTAREADVLLLDEPSNDLDLAGVEALEEALRSSRAAIVLATHDKRLAEALSGPVLGIDGGALDRYGDVARYLAGQPSRARPGTRSADRSGATGPSVDEHDAADTTAAPTSMAEHADADVDGLEPSTLSKLDRARVGSMGSDPASASSDLPGVLSLRALEDERQLIDDVLMDPLRLSQRERERLETRREDLDDALGEAYEARMPPPFPRFEVRENGLSVVADRTADGLVVLLPFPGADAAPAAQGGGSSTAYQSAARAATALAMAAMLHALDQADQAVPEGLTAGAQDRHGLPVTVSRTLPWVLVRGQAQVAHLALFEPVGSCLLPHARTALIEGAARFTFTLTSATALQLFCPEPLPHTRLLDAGGGWWSWSRNAFELAEGWRRPASVTKRDRRPKRPERQGPA